MANVVTTDDLLAAMRMGTSYTFAIAIRQFTLPVSLLSMAEQVNIATDVLAAMSNAPQVQRHSLNESHLIAKETLKRASALAAKGQTGMILSDQLLDKMTTDEVLFLYDQYRAGAEKLNPAVSDLSDEKLRELVDLAKKNPASLSDLSRQALEKVALFLLTPTD